jgi:hypothetical protein
MQPWSHGVQRHNIQELLSTKTPVQQNVNIEDTIKTQKMTPNVIDATVDQEPNSLNSPGMMVKTC